MSQTLRSKSDIGYKAVKRKKIFPLISTAVTVASLLGMSLTRGFHEKTSLDIFFSVILFSTALVPIYVCGYFQFLWICLGAWMLAVLQVLVLGVQLRLLPFLGLIGSVSMILLLVRRSRAIGMEHDRLRSAVLPLLIVVALAALNGPLLARLASLFPKTFDSALYAFDGTLGMQFSFAAGKVLRRWPWILDGALIVYCVLPVVLMLVFAQQLRRCGPDARRVLIAFCCAGPIGIIFYCLLPACGPAYFLGAKFPFNPPSMQQIGNVIAHGPPLNAYRNAFPSLHFAWALLAWWYSDGLVLFMRAALLIFLALTGVSALGLGEHYFVDLVAALPFALMIQATFALENPLFVGSRIKAFLGGLVSLLLWILLLRFGKGVFLSPLASWLLIASTCITCIYMQRHLRLLPAKVCENASR